MKDSAKAKIAMLQKGIRAKDVAQATGLSLNYVYRLINDLVVSKKGRAKIEAFLGQAIWSAPAIRGQAEQSSEFPSNTANTQQT